MRVLLVAPSINPMTYKGLGKYSREVYEGLRKYVEVDLIVKGSEKDKVLSTHSDIPLRLLRSGPHDIVHALSPEMGMYTPLLSKNTVTTFHDLIPILAFREMSFRFSLLTPFYTRLTWKISTLAKRLIANSFQTREELVNVLGVDPRKIRVIPLGADARFTCTNVPSTCRKPLTVGFFGNFTYRKRVNIAIEAFKLISRRLDAKLVLAGGKIETVYQRHFDLEQLTHALSNVEVLDRVEDANLPSLYRSFDVMLYPTSYEGFGLPILEAQRCGVPVLIMSDARIPREIVKEAVICDGAADMAQKALALLEDAKLRKDVSRRGVEYASKFSWENSIKETLKVYDELLRPKNSSTPRN